MSSIRASYIYNDHPASRAQHSHHLHPVRASMSSESQSISTMPYSSTNYADRRRPTRPRNDSSAGQSIASHMSRRTNQTNQTGTRSRRRERPPTPPPKDLPSFMPAMSPDEDNRSEIRALQSRVRGYLKRLVRIFKPRHRSSKSPSLSSEEEVYHYEQTATITTFSHSRYPTSPSPYYNGTSSEYRR